MISGWTILDPCVKVKATQRKGTILGTDGVEIYGDQYDT